MAILYEDGLVTIVECHPRDMFSYKKAKELFKSFSARKELVHITFKNQVEFLKWCKQNFKKEYFSEIEIKGQILEIKTRKYGKISKDYQMIIIKHLI